MQKTSATQVLWMAILFLFLTGATSVLAEETQSRPRTEITPFVGWRFGGSLEEETTGASIEFEDAKSFGLVIDYTIEPDKQVEIYISRQYTSLEGFDTDELNGESFKKDLTVDYYHIGGVYLISGDKLRPFVSGTIGLTVFNPDDPDLSSETKASLALGTGVKYYASKHLGLRLEGRGIFTLIGSDTAVFSKNGNMSIHVNGSGIAQGEVNAGLMFMF